MTRIGGVYIIKLLCLWYFSVAVIQYTNTFETLFLRAWCLLLGRKDRRRFNDRQSVKFFSGGPSSPIWSKFSKRSGVSNVHGVSLTIFKCKKSLSILAVGTDIPNASSTTRQMLFNFSLANGELKIFAKH